MRQPVRVLLVEDDENLRAAVRAELGAAGFDVVVAGDLARADAELRDDGFACVVLDRMLPDGDALDYVRRRRLEGWDARVLFMTARDRASDRIDGFTHGGDDYVVKPFSVAELTARVRSLARPGGSRPPVLRFADLEIDCARRETRRAGALLTLSGREFAVLEYLAVHHEQAVSRSDLIDHCWDESADPMSNVVDAVVKRLRRKLREPSLIHTVRGRGYRFGFADPAP
jgi:DNA-binding response OmpR family regulator